MLPALGNFTDPHNHYTFSGKEWDEHLNLYEFGARLYDPWAGLWSTQDPLRGEPRRPRTLHRYTYAFASPISYYDRYGLQGEGPPEFTPEGAQSGNQCTEAPPLWMGVLSAPWRILPYDFCMPGLGCWGGEEYADWLVNTYYPSLSWQMYWTWYHPAQAWGLPEDSLKTLMYENWFFELGKEDRLRFYENHPATQILMHHEGVGYYREQFYQSGYQDVIEQWYDVGQGTEGLARLLIEARSHTRIAFETVFQIEDSEQTIAGTVGSYRVTIIRNGDVANFEVYNPTTRESFMRTPWGSPFGRPSREETDPTWFSEQGWGGELKQFFIWTEPIPSDSSGSP